jgi:NarL family two-component system response regulator LiaR
MNKKKFQVSDDSKIKVLIFCPSDLILSGILKAIETDSLIEVVNIEKNTLESFMESIRKLRPHVILFASTETLPNMREICKAIREISKDQIKSQMLLLGNIPSHEEIVSLINVGARGYFDFNDPSGQLTEAIRVIHKGEIWLPRDKMSSIMDRIISVVGRDLKEKTLDQLTPTEFQVLKLIGQGRSNDEIGRICEFAHAGCQGASQGSGMTGML